ncbi:MAG: hypothetical protein Q6354_07140, partial [Candidatus Brocadiales bacterium]|nr:hypothetical protein [Candidatus Brocadiales bacterium]
MRKVLIFLVFLTTALCISITPARAELKGLIKADGSSTVFPITEAVAEEFQKKYPGVKVTVGLSG